MKTTFFSLKTLYIVLCFITLAAIVSISLLGENNKINIVAEYYFQNIKEKKYSDIDKLYSKASGGRFAAFDESVLFHFLLELTLLQYSELIDQEEYIIDTERESFWLPYTGRDKIHVSVAFRKKVNNGAWQDFFTGNDQKVARNLLTIIREDMNWKIDRVNLEGSGLQQEFDRLRSSLDLNRYISISPKNIHLKNQDIALQGLSPLDKKVLRYSLQKALESIDQSSYNN